ncbi:MAG: hypothetical protein QM731_09390 [Chitinophagaceae bacterium]
MRTIPYLFGLLMVTMLVSCAGDSKKLNRRVTLWRNDKIPYGTFYAYDNLQHIFPEATFSINKRSPLQGFSGNNGWYGENTQHRDNKTSYIIIGEKVIPDAKELNALLGMVGRGRHIFISALRISSNLLDSLRLKTAYTSGYLSQSDSLRINITNPSTFDSTDFTYPGDAYDNYFSSMDSSITTVLGHDEKGRANFVRFSYEGGGTLYIHLAPLAFSNFFLLHRNNKAYYDEALSYLPVNSEQVVWDEYYRYHENGDDGGDGGFSALSWIMKQRGFNVAFWLLLALLLIVYLFESKRKQRIIPVIQPLKNASLDFVKTIGRLYFQRKDNKNLAQKMTAHFMDYVRRRYNIRTATMNEEFEHKLSYKSGYDIEKVKDLLQDIRSVQDDKPVPDDMLLTLNHKLENFYKHT